MKLTTLMIMLCAFALVGCQTTAKFSCAGWTKPPKANDAVRMVQEERQLTKWLATADAFGQKQKCWK